MKEFLVNYCEFESEYMEKSIELYNADLLNFSKEYDILVISSVKNSFKPTSNSIIQKLYEKGINIEELSKNPAYDLRANNIDAWISQEINNSNLNFKRIICIEFGYHEKNIDSINNSLESLFSILSLIQSINNINMRIIAMPILGSGANNIPLQKILKKLFIETKKSLVDIKKLKKFYLVDIDEEKISIFDAVMTKSLKKINSELNYIFLDEDCKNICEDIKIYAQKLKYNKYLNLNCILDSLLIDLNDDKLTFFKLAIDSRILLEFLLSKKNTNYVSMKDATLNKRIKNYCDSKNISGWILNYMHIIRTISNTQVHDNTDYKYVPKYINIKDQKIFLKCVSRILEYFVEIEEFKNTNDFH